MKRAAILGMAVSLVAPLGAYAQGQRGGEGHGHHADRGEHQIMRFLESFDSDGDGQVDLDEVVASRSNRLSEFDADGNGTLNLEEYKTLWVDAYFERLVDDFQRHDDDGNGEVTVEEFTEDQVKMVKRLDSNNDGVVGMDEPKKGRR